jgi:type IV fimbrial biogenesis protein FimT
MHAINHHRGAGFSLIEALIALAIMGVCLAVGIPAMFDWVRATKLQAASEFYAEGFRLAHDEAVKRKASTRITLTTNASNGQLDWQIDLCYPSPTVVCGDNATNWSTTTAIATGDRDGAATGFKSIFRSSAHLLGAAVVKQSLLPVGSNQVYYTSLGWTDTSIPDNLTRLTLEPPTGTAPFPTVAIAVTLAGVASKCNPLIAPPDSRGCPP